MAFVSPTQAQSPIEIVPRLGQRLDNEQAAQLAKLAIGGLGREYPNKPGNVVTSPETVLSPKKLHPAFYGCFDWHSSVHGHWMLIRLLKLNPTHSLAQPSRQSLAINLTNENLLCLWKPKSLNSQ